MIFSHLGGFSTVVIYGRPQFNFKICFMIEWYFQQQFLGKIPEIKWSVCNRDFIEKCVIYTCVHFKLLMLLKSNFCVTCINVIATHFQNNNFGFESTHPSSVVCKVDYRPVTFPSNAQVGLAWDQTCRALLSLSSCLYCTFPF